MNENREGGDRMTFIINPLDLNEFSKEELAMAKFIAEQGCVTSFVEKKGDEKVLRYSFWKGLCDENYLFIDQLAQSQGVLKESIAFQNMTKTIQEKHMENEVVKYDLKFVTGCFHKDGVKKCSCKRCLLGVASYYHHLKEYGDLVKEAKIIEDEDKVKAFQEEIDALLQSDEIKEELREILKLLSFIKWCRDNGLDTPKPKLYYTLIKREGVNHYAITNLINKMLYEMGIQESEKCYRIDLKNPGNRKNCSYHRLTIIEGLSSLSQESEYRPTAQEVIDAERRSAILENLMEDFENFMVIVRGTESEIKSFLNYDPKIRAIFKKQFILKDFGEREIYNLFLKEATKYSCQLADGFEQACLGHIQQYRNRSPYKNADFATYLFQQVLMNKLSKDDQRLTFRVLSIDDLPEEKQKVVDLEDRLKSLIGMKEIKDNLRELQNYLKYEKRIRPFQTEQPKLNLHMLITGNPGTGKTTVARIIAETLYNLGYLEESKCLEVEAKDLIAGYVGQTALKTSRLIEEAMGGVLFIDEAYMLRANERNTFNAEAIATLIKAMEDHKDRLVVIFAGYEKEMKDFVASNSGILSRIGYSFNIKDYSLEELNGIALLKLTQMGYSMNDLAKEKLSKILEEGMKVKNFGNGRFVMNAIQAILLNHAMRVDELSDEDLFILTETDISDEVKDELLTQLKEMKRNDVSIKKIGFQPQK